VHFEKLLLLILQVTCDLLEIFEFAGSFKYFDLAILPRLSGIQAL
jgi:hypothetical protein